MFLKKNPKKKKKWFSFSRPGVIGGRGGRVRVSATTSFGVGMAFLSDLQGFSVLATSVTTATVRGS